MLDSLILCLFEYKTQKDYEGKDMEADLVTMYEDVRKFMASLYPLEEFGPEESSLVNQELNTRKKKLIKIGYERIKERVKLLRQNFKKAVV